MRIKFSLLTIDIRLFDRSEDQPVEAIVGSAQSADLTVTEAALDRVETTRLGYWPSEHK